MRKAEHVVEELEARGEDGVFGACRVVGRGFGEGLATGEPGCSAEVPASFWVGGGGRGRAGGRHRAWGWGKRRSRRRGLDDGDERFGWMRSDPFLLSREMSCGRGGSGVRFPWGRTDQALCVIYLARTDGLPPLFLCQAQRKAQGSLPCSRPLDALKMSSGAEKAKLAALEKKRKAMLVSLSPLRPVLRPSHSSPPLDHHSTLHEPAFDRRASLRKSRNSSQRLPATGLVSRMSAILGPPTRADSVILTSLPTHAVTIMSTTIGSDRFTSKTDGVEDSLKRSTYGLVQLRSVSASSRTLSYRSLPCGLCTLQ